AHFLHCLISPLPLRPAQYSITPTLHYSVLFLPRCAGKEKAPPPLERPATGLDCGAFERTAPPGYAQEGYDRIRTGAIPPFQLECCGGEFAMARRGESAGSRV